MKTQTSILCIAAAVWLASPAPTMAAETAQPVTPAPEQEAKPQDQPAAPAATEPTASSGFVPEGPRVTKEVSNCDKGLADNGTVPLLFVHTAGAVSTLGGGDELYLNGVQSKLSYDGHLYSLRLVTLSAKEFAPFSGVSYPMKIRLDYADENEAHVSVDIPVSPGKSNLAMEKILVSKNSVIDPGAFFPADLSYAMAQPCEMFGLPLLQVVMATPLEISASQLERFKAALNP